MSLRAIIFGSIGTVTETSELQRRSFNAAFAAAGLDWYWDMDDYRAMVAGAQSTVGGAARIADHAARIGQPIDAATAAALHADKTARFQATMRADGLPLNPGVADLIDEARLSGVRVALASSTARASIDTMLGAITGGAIAGCFDLILSGDDARAKPDPAVYRVALDRLRLTADTVLAIEDSAPSAAAAIAAGLGTIVVPGRLWQGVAVADAHVIPTLAGLTIADLVRIVRGR